MTGEERRTNWRRGRKPMREKEEGYKLGESKTGDKRRGIEERKSKMIVKCKVQLKTTE